MDYDDDEFQGQNRQLAGLHPYTLPKFDFDNNQWIEKYSRGNSGIDFNSSNFESRRNNVRSEAPSSKSVEILLNSVGQEEKVVKETITENLDPNLNQESRKNQISGGELNLVSEEKMENIINLGNESMVDNPGPSENTCKTIEELKIQENPKTDSVDARVAITDSNKNTAETDDQPKSPIFGVSLEHQDNKEKAEVGIFPCEQNSQNEIPDASGSENPTTLVEKEASTVLDKEVVHAIDAHCASQIEQKTETNDARQEIGNNPQIGGLQDPKESILEARPSEINVEEKQEASKNVTHDSSVPSKITDDVENKIMSVSSCKATHKEKNLSSEITEGPSKDSRNSPQNRSGLTSQIMVKGKSERKPRRKSVGNVTAKKSNHPKEITTHFEGVKSHENVTKPRGVFSSLKLPDLNNSTSIFHHPFSDNQQVQLRAQILVHGSLIAGSPPEEPHMIAAFGQSDGGRTWEGVWRAYLERLHVLKSPMQPRSGTPPNITPVIPLSSPLWNISTPLNKTEHNFSGRNNPSFLSQGPFAGQRVAITTPVKVTHVKESGVLDIKQSSNSTAHNSPPTMLPEPSGDSKSRKRKNASRSPTPHLPKNVDKVVISKESLTKVNESKLQSEEANKHATNAASHSHVVWSHLEKTRYNNYVLNSDDEAKLVSSAVSIAAAASVAKVAAAAAKIASDFADQAKSMVNGFDKANNDAILKAAELAAEAVSQVGKVVAMSERVPLRDLVEAGPEGYWKNLNGSKKKNDESTPDVSGKGIVIMKSGLLGEGYFGNLAENQIMEVDTFSDSLKESNIKEGCFVEVYKDDDNYNGAWFGANVLSLKDGKALVSYTDIQSDEGQLKEWVPLEIKGTEVPKMRIAHPLTNMRLEGTRKRHRTALTNFVWFSGDRVDVWIQDRWREGVVVETNKIDVTSLTVRFPAQAETLVVRSWFVRPTLVWKDGKWIECQTSDKRLSSQGDSPQQKRIKLVNPVMESKRNNESSESVDHVDPMKKEETKTLTLSTHENIFNIGSTKSGKKDAPRVIFGVPKPGKKQKFIADVSKHYVADVSNKNNDSVKFTKYLIPQAPKEKQAGQTKSRIVKARKPPMPAGRPLTFSKPTTRENNTENKTSRDSVNDGENQSGHLVSTESERLEKRKFAPTGGKAVTVEKPLPEFGEPRRSNRKMQPTSRLLEGLQSSLTISKTPAASHPKGNTNDV